MSETLRMRLPLIATGQAQKEVTHNEALTSLDLIVHGSVLDIGRLDPPASPQEGDAHILGTPTTGAFAGFDSHVAFRVNGAWRFEPPFEGLRLRVRDLAQEALFENGMWQTGVIGAARIEIDGKQILGPQRPAIPAPMGGTTVDAEARATLEAILSALTAHGLIASV
ncbi:MAG: hypothetical protein Tsb008_18640 [Rhodothalassiaceae bacterium]